MPAQTVCSTFELPDGFTIVELRTPADLETEAAGMRHCIARQRYREFLGVSGNGYFSLRDRKNRPHVTMQVWDRGLVECRGKQNLTPVPCYLDHVRSFIEQAGLHLTLDVSHLGLMVVKGRCLDAAHLPDGMKVTGRDEALLFSGPRIHQLPEELEVEGQISLLETNVRELPDTLKTRCLTLLRNWDIPQPPGVGEMRKFDCLPQTSDLPRFERERVRWDLEAGRQPPPSLNRRITQLDLTDISDLGVLAPFHELRCLTLRGTQVQDLAPLARLAQLDRLVLIETSVTDLSPLTGLTSLREVYLDPKADRDRLARSLGKRRRIVMRLSPSLYEMATLGLLP